MPLRKLKYSKKIQVLFIPVFALMVIGLLIVYKISVNSLREEHTERLLRTAHLIDDELKKTEQEMLKLVHLFQTNRTVTEYLYISTVLGGDRRPLKDLMKPMADSLNIDSLVLYDKQGSSIVKLDRNNTRKDGLSALTGALPREETYGFTKASGTLKIAAVGPLMSGNMTVGYISVGAYLDPGLNRELKGLSGNELFWVDDRSLIISPGGGTAVYAPRDGKLSMDDTVYSVHEQKIAGMDGTPLGMIVVALSDKDLRNSVAKLKFTMFGLLSAAALLSFGLAALFIKTLVDPLKTITLFTGKVARGEFESELPTEGKDEFAALARHFNEMQSQLKAQRDLVRTYTGNLERAVEERSKELDKVQRQLLQSQKMEAVGQLAGGIAHDFNNFLTAIIGYAGIFQKKLAKDDPLRTHADQIIATSKRAAGLTRGLLTFSRKQVINPMPMDLNEIVKDAEKMMLRLIGEDIELKTALSDSLLTVMADSGQIEQVLLNLATNARDAMPGGGRLLIETRTVDLDDAFVRRNGYGKSGAYALLIVTDTGTGMDDATKEKIFEPFFTTKEAGKGTGLGLSMVYGIVKQHEGFINVYSEKGAGTAFKVYLPLIRMETGTRPPAEQGAPPAGGAETVLLAEDNEVVRELTRSGLEEVGYTVIAAADGEEALQKFIAGKDTIQLLVLDVVMPKKNGKEVYEAIRKIKPGIKAIFTSGYTADIVQKKGIVDDGSSLVLKPYSQNDFLKKVREALDADRRSTLT